MANRIRAFVCRGNCSTVLVGEHMCSAVRVKRNVEQEPCGRGKMGKKAAFTLVALCIASLVLLGTPAAKAQLPLFSSELPPSVHILANGSFDPPTAAVSRAGNVYTLTGDVGVNITVDKDNITIDGAGHTLWGNFSGGVHLDYRLGVTVKNLVIKEAGYAFSLYKAADNTFVGNTLANCSIGFYFWVSWRNIITGNTLMNVGTAFDFVDSSQHNIIVGNVIQNCGTAIEPESAEQCVFRQHRDRQLRFGSVAFS